MRFANRLQNMADTRLPKAVFRTTWVRRGSNLGHTNLSSKIWIRLIIPDATMRGEEIPKMDRLSPCEFNVQLLKWVQQEKIPQQMIRNNPKLALDTIVCELELK